MLKQSTLPDILSTAAKSVAKHSIARTVCPLIHSDPIALSQTFNVVQFTSMHLWEKEKFNKIILTYLKTTIGSFTWLNTFSFLDADARLDEYIERVAETGHWMCKTCGKTTSKKWNIQSHIEAIHFAGQFVYTCQLCGKTFNSKNSLTTHSSRSHRPSTWSYLVCSICWWTVAVRIVFSIMTSIKYTWSLLYSLISC